MLQKTTRYLVIKPSTEEDFNTFFKVGMVIELESDYSCRQWNIGHTALYPEEIENCLKRLPDKLPED